MLTTSTFSKKYLTGVFSLVLVVLLLSSGEAEAQFEMRWLSAGALEHGYLASGHEQENWDGALGMKWPAIAPYAGHNRGNAFWIGAKNFADEKGDKYSYKVVHIGPRSPGIGEFFAQKFELYNRFPLPKVTVDGLETFKRAQDVDEVRPDMAADQMLHTETTNQLGVKVERNLMQFSQKYHDNYHIREYIITNTGNVDDDPDLELDKKLEGVRVLFQKRPQMTGGAWAYYPGSAWGANILGDMVNDGMDDYDVPFDNFAEYRWPGNSPNADISPLGGPVRQNWPWFIQEGDTVGRLREAWTLGTMTLEANRPKEWPSEHNNPGSYNLDAHPTTSSYYDTDGEYTGASDPYNKSQMRGEYETMMDRGHIYPHMADASDIDGDFTTPDGDSKLGSVGGYKNMWGYGPYDLEVGESVRIVHVEGVDGFQPDEAYNIGKLWKATDWDADAVLEYDGNGNGVIDNDEKMTKDEWVLTTRDSLNKMFLRAMANYKSGFDIPRPPKPPKSFSVTSGVNAVELGWTTFPESGENGFEIYRSKNYVEGNINNKFHYRKIATVNQPGDGSYRDEDVVRGADYFYYIQAVGDVNNDTTGMTPTGQPLKSSRYWTQTYAPAALKRPPGEELSSARVVPNPLNLASEESVRFSGMENRIAFLDIPGNCTIRIYTELGELVKVVEHTDGSGDEFWNLTTRNQQIVATGIYIALIQDNKTGKQTSRKFTIVR